MLTSVRARPAVACLLPDSPASMRGFFTPKAASLSLIRKVLVNLNQYPKESPAATTGEMRASAGSNRPRHEQPGSHPEHQTKPIDSIANEASPGAASASSSVTFRALGLKPELLRALEDEGYQAPTPIQAQAIPHVLSGRDLFGCAQTGTGKTAAFALPILQRLSSSSQGAPNVIRTLVLSPTRELASQIGESFNTYGKYLKIRHTTIYGGVSQMNQVKVLRRGVEVLIATPGRLCDLLNQGLVNLSKVEILVLDEADRMLDMGFLPDMRRVLRVVPQERQTLLFSATMPKEIESLAQSISKNSVRVSATPVATPAERVDQRVYFVDQRAKADLMLQILEDRDVSRAIVFTRTKHGANRVTERLARGSIAAAAIHGNKSQSARERALAQFKAGSLRVLVATDIAARGIDVSDVTHVINYDLPNEPETYVHRIGRTARAGANGVALSFCSAEEKQHLARIERLVRQRVAVAVAKALPERPQTSRPLSREPELREREPRRNFRGAGRPGRSYRPGGPR